MILAVRKSGGFSLIELAIIVTIIGLLMSAGMQTYRVYINTKVVNDTEQRRDAVKEAMARHLFNFGFLPCPAGPALAPDTVNAGKSQMNGTVAPEDSRCENWSQAAGYCNPVSGICRVDGARHSACNPNAVTVKDPVLIGSVPYVDLGIPLTDTIDGWGNRMTYAVSYYLTQAGTYSDQCGAVNVKTYSRSTGNTSPMWSPLLPENQDDSAPTYNTGNNIAGGFMYAIVSHGPDGRGAYTYYGQPGPACGTGRLDVENCNGDAIFVNRGDNETDSAYSLGTGSALALTKYYDDAFVLMDVTKDRDKWTRPSLTSIENKAGGRVGIGGVPDAANDYRLDVEGNMKLIDYQADDICSNTPDGAGWTGPLCFSQDMIGGSGITCGDGMMTGIVNGVQTCVSRISTVGLVPGTCPTGQLLKGFTALGGIICQTP
ncbi:MAG: type II secretion system protein [Alphaproteobacteria bacterium]